MTPRDAEARTCGACSGAPARRRSARRRRPAASALRCQDSPRCVEPGLLLALEAELDVRPRARAPAARERVERGQQRDDRRLVVGGGAGVQPPLVADRAAEGGGDRGAAGVPPAVLPAAGVRAVLPRPGTAAGRRPVRSASARTGASTSPPASPAGRRSARTGRGAGRPGGPGRGRSPAARRRPGRPPRPPRRGRAAGPRSRPRCGAAPARPRSRCPAPAARRTRPAPGRVLPPPRPDGVEHRSLDLVRVTHPRQRTPPPDEPPAPRRDRASGLAAARTRWDRLFRELGWAHTRTGRAVQLARRRRRVRGAVAVPGLLADVPDHAAGPGSTTSR